MSDYAGIHGGDKIYCGVAIQPYLTADGALTGTSCHSILATGAVGSLVINNASIAYNYSGDTWIGGDGGSGLGGNSGGERPVNSYSDPTTTYYRLGIQGLRN